MKLPYLLIIETINQMSLTIDNLNDQYGFRFGHSTEHAALELTDRIITNIDNKKVH